MTHKTLLPTPPRPAFSWYELAVIYQLVYGAVPDPTDLVKCAAIRELLGRLEKNKSEILFYGAEEKKMIASHGN